MKTHAFTWLGLAIVVLGWALLVFDIVAGDTVAKSGTLVATLSLRADIMTIAQTAILSGFGLTITGVLTSGFGAFSRFFDAVLYRSSSPRTPAPAPVAPSFRDSSPMSPPMSPSSAAPPVVMPIERSPPPAPPPPLRSKEHNYVILADGSVEVETMFGTRIFATLDEAREFIR